MAQPPEPSPLRLQSSLDSAPVKPRVQPDPDALAQKHYHGLQHQQQTRQDSQPPPALPQTQTSDAPSTDCGLYSIDNRGKRTPVVDIEKVASDGVSAVNASSNHHASVATPLDSAQDTHGTYSTRSEAQHNRDAPALNPPDMSNTQPPPRPRQPVTYASSMPYPSAGIQSVSHYTYPPQAIPVADPYRPSPTTLPSMRTLDHGQPQVQPQQQQHGLSMSAHMAAPMTPAPAPGPMAYYAVHPHAHVYGLSDPNAMRFPLAPGMGHDPRIAMSGGRHKKEIKRRTKTGCLTCRKRRIKCDEAHPTCNNCKKSKRDCLGYDPIFKQQQGPTAIQPAPVNSQPPAPAIVVPAPTVPSSTAHHPYQASYSHSLPSSLPPDSVVSTTPQSIKTEPGYLYSTAIDPALQGSDTASVSGTRGLRYQQNNIAVGVEQGAGDFNHLRGGTPSSPSTLSALSQSQSREIMSAHTISPAKKMKVDELVALGGAAPQAPSSPPPAHILDEITKLYYEVYVPGLTSFFETRWYDFAKSRATTTNPAAMLHSNQYLISLFASFVQTIYKIQSTDLVDMVQAGHLETCVVWTLACLPLSAPLSQSHQHLGSGPGEDDDLWEARGRLQVFETLIAGETLASIPLPPPHAGIANTARRNEVEFWYHLAKFLLQDHASASPGDVSARENCLDVMRSRLDGRENRDVLYSIAVLREYTAHWDASWNEQTVPSHLDESDSRSKLAVATRFIRGESTSTGGTTNVVRRFADLACRAFVRPGVNVDKGRDGRG